MVNWEMFQFSMNPSYNLNPKLKAKYQVENEILHKSQKNIFKGQITILC
jgi:hypothetical protein